MTTAVSFTRLGSLYLLRFAYNADLVALVKTVPSFCPVLAPAHQGVDGPRRLRPAVGRGHEGARPPRHRPGVRAREAQTAAQRRHLLLVALPTAGPPAAVGHDGAYGMGFAEVAQELFGDRP